MHVESHGMPMATLAFLTSHRAGGEGTAVISVQSQSSWPACFTVLHGKVPGREQSARQR
jgi:hypothetical protein